MNVLCRALLLTGLVATALSVSGCNSMWHELQPHRLHRLNQGPGMPTGSEAYSLASTEAPHLA